MNRILKFRGWVKDGDTSIMQPVEEMVFYERGGVAEINDWWDDSRFILMQYTGLKDKNGVEIYEGDIVKHKAFGIKEISWGSKAENNLFADMACFMFNGTIAFLSGSESEEMEVIGSIYENPELLEV